jgi:hypothetical protein
MTRHEELQLRCPQCGHREVVGFLEMVDHLRQLGMFKRQREPDPQLVRELFGEQIPLLRCRGCGAIGFGRDSSDDWNDELWGGARQCEICRVPIAAERLEVFPDTRLCVKCQQAADVGRDAAEPEYCPRCGAIMQLTERGGTGLAGYVMRCPDCRYRSV